MAIYDATPEPGVSVVIWLITAISIFYGFLIFVRPQLADHGFFYDAILRLKGSWAATAFLGVGRLAL